MNAGKWQGWLVLAIPLAVIAATLLMRPTNSLESQQLLAELGTTNHGEWIVPAQWLDLVRVRTVAGAAWQGNNKWKLLVVDSGDCGEDCRRQLYIARQLHTLMSKRANRIERLYLSPQPPSPQQQAHLASEYPGVTALIDGGALARQLLHTNVPSGRDDLLLLLDPRGQLVLYYTASHDYKQIIKDLKVLL